MNASSGRFITFEGGEGSGKSTQIALLAGALRGEGVQTLVTREPGGVPGAEEIRALLVKGEVNRWSPLTEALLNYAARVEHVEKSIRPALAEGKWVLCDRFADSTMAYQGYGHGLGREPVETLHAVAVGDFRPDVTLILDIPPAAGLARANDGTGGEDRYERMDLSFHERLRDGFLDIARREPGRCVLIDATQSLDAVAAAVRSAIRDRLRVRLAP